MPIPKTPKARASSPHAPSTGSSSSSDDLPDEVEEEDEEEAVLTPVKTAKKAVGIEDLPPFPTPEWIDSFTSWPERRALMVECHTMSNSTLHAITTKFEAARLVMPPKIRPVCFTKAHFVEFWNTALAIANSNADGDTSSDKLPSPLPSLSRSRSRSRSRSKPRESPPPSFLSPSRQHSETSTSRKRERPDVPDHGSPGMSIRLHRLMILTKVADDQKPIKKKRKNAHVDDDDGF